MLFSGLDTLTEGASGQIVVEGGAKPVAQSATIAPALQPFVDWPSVFIGASLGGAAILMSLVAARSVEGRKGWGVLCGRAPGAKWSFESWATHLTAAGGLFGTVLAAASLPPAPMQIDKESLVALSLLFPALAVSAPFVFQALRRAKVDAAAEEDGRWGYKWALLVACWLTLSAVFGELATLGLLAWVIVGGGLGGVVLEVGLATLVVLAAYYVVTTSYALVSTDWDSVASEGRKDAHDMLKGVRSALAAADGPALRHVDVSPKLEAPRLSWRVL